MKKISLFNINRIWRRDKGPVSLVAFCGLLLVSQMERSVAADPMDVWHKRPTPADSVKHLENLLYAGGKFVASGHSGFMVSVDGVTWQKYAAPEAGPFVATAFGNGKYVSVGLSKTILTSPDAMTWTLAAKDADFFAERYNDVIFDGEQFITVGGGIIKTSPDGILWTTRHEEEDFYPGGIARGQGLYVVVGTKSHGEVRTSPDAITWTAHDYHAENGLADVAFGNGVFVAAGDRGTIISSPNAVDWTPRTSNISGHFFSVTFVNGLFFALGQFGAALTSSDGTNWIARDLLTRNDLSGVAYGQGTIVIVGSYETIRQSDPVPPANTGDGGEAAAPRLKCTQQGDQMIVSWPLSTVGFTLEESDDLGGRFWGPAFEPIVDTRTEHTVTIQPIGLRYFRLRKSGND
jgi:hypothetical protein